jgi:hypothetical protein
MNAEISDLVDVHFQPFVRALGNLVITFALAKAALLDLVAEMHGQRSRSRSWWSARRCSERTALLRSSSCRCPGAGRT